MAYARMDLLLFDRATVPHAVQALALDSCCESPARIIRFCAVDKTLAIAACNVSRSPSSADSGEATSANSPSSKSICLSMAASSASAASRRLRDCVRSASSSSRPP